MSVCRCLGNHPQTLTPPLFHPQVQLVVGRFCHLANRYYSARYILFLSSPSVPLGLEMSKRLAYYSITYTTLALNPLPQNKFTSYPTSSTSQHEKRTIIKLHFFPFKTAPDLYARFARHRVSRGGGTENKHRKMKRSKLPGFAALCVFHFAFFAGNFSQ